MTTSTNIKLNIVAPDAPAPAPVDPAVPNTGLFTHGIGAPEATIIVSVVLILAIVGIILAAYMYRKHKKADKVTKLVHIIDSTKAVIKSKKRISSGLAAIALLISAGTFIALAKNGVNAAEGEEQATEDTDSSSLTVDVSSEELTIEVADSPVFAVLPVEVTVEEATDLGYTLTACTDSTDLVSTTNPDNTIPMVTVDTTDIEEANETEETNEVEASDSSTLVPLSPNTYGLSFTNPESVLDEVFTSLSTDSSAPTLITDKAYEATEENDTTTIYYGFYITPDTPYGTYVGSDISVDAIPNIATVTYDANGLYYNNDESFTINTVGYKPNVAEAPIEEVTGEYLTPAPLTPSAPSTSIHYTFLGWSEDKDATEATYVDEEDILANLTLTKNESLTLYAVWHYNTVLSFNGNTSDGGEPIADITIPAGTTITLPPNTYTRTGSVFTNWNTVAEPTEQDPGEDYEDQTDFTAPAESEDITLYAQWAYYTTITFSGNGADSGYMPGIMATGGQQTTLPQNTFTKDGYFFASWNTSPDGTGEAYSDQSQYTAPVSESQNITLYAQWIDCAPNSICYKDNGANSPTTMDPQSASSGTDITLWASNYKYDTNNDGHNDYGFAGWSEDKDAAAKLADNDSTNNPVVYGPNQTITTGDLSTEGMKLYAVWIAPEQNTTFQTFTCPSNTDMPIGTVIALRDNRDNEVYTVAKLADGNCWMTENLRLDNNATINAANTNSPISTFTALSPSSDSWCTDWTESCYNQSMLNTKNITNTVSPMTGTNANTYSYSNYYNWYSATAGNGTYSKSSGTVAGDLCPAGWHLPYGGSKTSEKGGNTSGGFYYLNEQLGGGTGTAASKNLRSFPNNFVYSGYWYGSSASSRGGYGFYWSSTAGNTVSAYYLYFYSGYVRPGADASKYSGYSVRCVAPVQ